MNARRMLVAAALFLHAGCIAQDDVVHVSAPRLYAGEKISVDFQNVGVRAALHILADASGQNIVASDSVAGNVTLRLRDLPWDQALDVLLQAKGLDVRRNGNVLWIAPREEILARERLELEQRAQIAELEPLQSAIFQLNYQKAEAFRTVFGLDAGEGRSRLLSRRGSVLIEPRIVEANDSFSRNLGARLGFSDQRLAAGQVPGFSLGGSGRRAAVGGSYQGVGEATGQTVAGSGAFVPNTQFVNLPAASINGLQPASFALSLFSAAANRFLNLELSALEADGRGKIISSPRVVTADKVLALIEQGIELPYQVATSSGATSITFRKANLRLEVTPQITPDGNVVLEVDVNKDSVGQETRSGFAIDTKHVRTQVMVEDGGTVVLGGIYQQSERGTDSKVPLLGDIPVLGVFFRSTGRSQEKTELMVFITPKIVADQPATR